MKILISRREFIRQSAFWTGVSGAGMLGSRKAFAAMDPVPVAAPAGKETDLIAKVLSFVREEQVDFFGIGQMAAAYQTMETVLKTRIPQESRLPRVISLALRAVEGTRGGLSHSSLDENGTIPWSRPMRPRLTPATSRLCELLKAKGYSATTQPCYTGDFNGDGLPDILASSKKGTCIHTLQWEGPGVKQSDIPTTALSHHLEHRQ
jgi:hypothetical protein